MEHFSHCRGAVYSAAKNPAKLRSLVTPFVAFLAAFAGSSAAAGDEMVPDFALMDVNSTSSTYGQPVSPRDYLQQVSGWYFGHAT